MVVGFTRDYEEIRKALTTLEHYDKTSVENVLQGINDILTSTWGTHNFCQVLMVSDCGIGMRSSSVVEVVNGLIKRKQTNDDSYNWLPFTCPSRINFCCLGNPNDNGFRNGEWRTLLTQLSILIIANSRPQPPLSTRTYWTTVASQASSSCRNAMTCPLRIPRRSSLLCVNGFVMRTTDNSRLL